MNWITKNRLETSKEAVIYLPEYLLPHSLTSEVIVFGTISFDSRMPHVIPDIFKHSDQSTIFYSLLCCPFCHRTPNWYFSRIMPSCTLQTLLLIIPQLIHCLLLIVFYWLSTTDYIRAGQTLPWIARSLDLSPVEYFWDLMRLNLRLTKGHYDWSWQLDRLVQEIRQKDMHTLYMSRSKAVYIRTRCGRRSY